jgi:nitrite reductase (NADH) small subunit/3-phenylpropionate/trans-cinnamate dioxygenase ferredoxin subunit
LSSNEFVPVGRVSDFAPGAGKMVSVSGRHVAVFRLGDEFFALDNMCLHRGGPLCEGPVTSAKGKAIVTCPWHGWSYEIRTGMMVQDPRVGVSKHDVRIDGDQVAVRLTD